MHPIVQSLTRSRQFRMVPGFIALVLFIPLAFGTSPLPPPYHRYVVSGTVSHRDGTPAGEVILIGFTRTAYDTALVMSRGAGTSEERPLGVSDASGQFVLSLHTYTRAESLAIGAIAPGRPMVRGATFHPDSSLAYATRAKGTSTIETGCGGCGTDPPVFEYTVNYTTMISNSVTIE